MAFSSLSIYWQDTSERVLGVGGELIVPLRTALFLQVCLPYLTTLLQYPPGFHMALGPIHTVL